jgi:hypothetical protein
VATAPLLPRAAQFHATDATMPTQARLGHIRDWVNSGLHDVEFSEKLRREASALPA